MGTSLVAPASRSKIANQIYKSNSIPAQVASLGWGGGTYEGALVCAIKVREELVDARLRDQVVLRERKTLRIERARLDKGQINIRDCVWWKHGRDSGSRLTMPPISLSASSSAQFPTAPSQSVTSVTLTVALRASWSWNPSASYSLFEPK
jgi:hypothetical protein